MKTKNTKYRGARIIKVRQLERSVDATCMTFSSDLYANQN
jgi:hypothetical protein